MRVRRVVEEEERQGDWVVGWREWMGDDSLPYLTCRVDGGG